VTGEVGGSMLGYPFDQYQRYQVTSDLLGLLEVPDGARIVDVGGAPGPAEAFLGRFDVTVLDLDDRRAGRYVRASGAALPFADGAFAAVVTHDTLEHVPRAERAPFLAEARRVSDDLVVLCAPFDDPLVRLAEDALGEFVTQRLGGFPTLEEHGEHGLPDLAATRGALGADGWSTATLPSGYLPRWLVGMVVHHELLATGVPQLDRMHAYYNATVSPYDCREPAYRHVVLASRRRSAEELEAATKALRTDADGAEASAALQALAGALAAQRVGGLYRLPGIELERRIAQLERDLSERDGRIATLETELEKIRSVASLAVTTYRRIRRAGTS
jgi:SAM-dependent methyltransferase